MPNKLKLSGLFLGSTVLLILLLCTTHPTSVSLPLIMAPFILMFVSLSSGALLLMGIRRIPTRKNVVLAVIIGALPVLLLVMKSIGQLGIKDLLIAAGLLILGWIYISRLNLRDDKQR